MKTFTCHCNNLDTVLSEETLQKVEPQGYTLVGTTTLEDEWEMKSTLGKIDHVEYQMKYSLFGNNPQHKKNYRRI